MGDNLEVEAVEAPPPPGTNKVEITVGGHSVVVESADPLVDVAGYALGMFEQTRDDAKKLPFGFDVAGGQFQHAEPYAEPGGMEGWEDARARSRDGATRRLDLGAYRARLRPAQSVNR